MTALPAIARAIHIAASLLPLPAFAVPLLVEPRAARGDGKFAPARLVMWCLPVAFVSGFVWLWCSVAGMSGCTLTDSLQLDLFRLVLAETQPGHVWILRAVLLLLLFGISLRMRMARPTAALTLLGGLIAACLAASLAWLGHAGAAEGAQLNIHLSSDILHLLAAAIWPCGLLPFALLLRNRLRSHDSVSIHAAADATRNFSSLSIAAVGLLAATGSVNSWLLLGSFQAFLTTAYGRILAIKLLFFLAMMMLGAFNLLRLKPRLSGNSVANDTATLKKIILNVWLELLLGAFVLLATGFLGMTAPAAH